MKDGADRSILIEMQYTAKNIPDTEREFSWTQRGKMGGVGTHHRQGRSRGCKRWHDRVACELRRGAAARTLEGGEREGGGDQGKRWGKWRDIKKAERERRGELRQRLRLLNKLWGFNISPAAFAPPGLNSSSSSLTPYLPRLGRQGQHFPSQEFFHRRGAVLLQMFLGGLAGTPYGW
jgi:hypothetical protein